MAAHAVCVRASAGPGGHSPGPAVRRAWRLAAALAVLLASPAVAQGPVVWERLPDLPIPLGEASQYASDLGFLTGRGTAGPGQDTLVITHGHGVFRYAPGENNGEWGDWHRMRGAYYEDMHITDDHDWFVTYRLWRTRNSGRTWEMVLDPAYTPIIESRSPCLREQSGGRSVMVVPFDINNHKISLSGGDPGTWTTGGPASFYTGMLFDVPASPALPCGRILENGTHVMYSDDGIQTWHLADMRPHLAGPQPQPQWSYVKFRFAWVPREGHPYGGVVIGIGCSVHYCDSVGSPQHPTRSSAVVWRSDDGGATFEPVFEFTSAVTGITVQPGSIGPNRGVPYLGPDGALYAGVSNNTSTVAGVGRVFRSWDAGTTWEAADDGFRVPNVSPYGVVIHNFATAADGRLYMATQRGIWRTVQPVVSAEAQPAPEAPSLSVAVAPNPARGRFTVTATLGADAASATVDVFDLTGRIVAVLHGGALAAGSHRFEVDTGGWSAGVYLARVYAAGRQETARITVAR